jgi:8-oxo-dGTP diphosphatase
MKRKTVPKELLTQLAVDVVIFTVIDERMQVLLIKRQWQPYESFWSLPGGFMRQNESTIQAAQRILHEKAGLTKDVYIEQLYTFDASGRDPRGNIPTVTYMTLIPQEQLTFSTSKKSQEPQFMALSKMPNLAFDHSTIIRYALHRLRSKLEYTNIIYSLLPKMFTLTDLQHAYETVLEKKLDKRNFRKKYLSLGLIRSTGKTQRGGQRRPALLYAFTARKPAELKKFL